MPIREDDVGQYPLVVRAEQKARELDLPEGAYVRIRRAPYGVDAFRVGGFANANRDDFRDRLVEGILDAGSSDPLYIEIMAEKGKKVLWHTTIPGLAGAIAQQFQDNQKTNGTNADPIALGALQVLERTNRDYATALKDMQSFWLSAEDRRLTGEESVLDMKLDLALAELGLFDEDAEDDATWLNSPNVKEAITTFSTLFKVPVGQVGKLAAAVAAHINAGRKTDTGKPDKPPPAPKPKPKPDPEPEPSPSGGDAGGAAAPPDENVVDVEAVDIESDDAGQDGQDGDAGQDGQDGQDGDDDPTDDEIADSVFDYIDYLADEAPLVLVDPARLERAKKHLKLLKTLVAMIDDEDEDAATEDGTPTTEPEAPDEKTASEPKAKKKAKAKAKPKAKKKKSDDGSDDGSNGAG